MNWSLEQLRIMIDEREEAEQQRRNSLLRRLRAMGWNYNCYNPMKCWMFERLLPDGRIVLLDNAESALRMEHSIKAAESQENHGGDD